MARIHLILMPEFMFFSPLLPPLSMAGLAAYLKSNGVAVTCTDFKQSMSCYDIFCTDSLRTLFGGVIYVDELAELPLILTMVRNYQQGQALLRGFEEPLLDFIQHRSLNYYLLKQHIDDTYRLLDKEAQRMSRRSHIFGFTVVSANLFYTVMFSLMLRQINPRIKIIYLGPQMMFSEHTVKLVLRLPIADIVIPGEAESTMLKLLCAYDRNASAALAGTVAFDKKRGTFCIKPPQRLLDFRALPDPDFSTFPTGFYQPLTLPIEVCREYRGFFYRKKRDIYRLRKPRDVVDAMERLHQKYGTIKFNFCGGPLNRSTLWLGHIADELIKRKCNFLWEGSFRPTATSELIQKLKQSGLCAVKIDAYSFSDRVLAKVFKRPIPTGVTVQAIRRLCEADIEVAIAITAGFPGESKRDFLSTVKTILQLEDAYPRAIRIHPQLFQLRPGTPWYAQYRKYGIKIQTWGARTCGIIPEISGFVKRIPIVFLNKKPTNREASDRLAVLKNIVPKPQCSLTSEKRFLEACLRHLRHSSIVVVDAPQQRFHPCTIPKTKKIFFSFNTIPFDEQELFVVKRCNGSNTIADIVESASAKYTKTKQESLRLVMHVLRLLIQHNARVTIRTL